VPRHPEKPLVRVLVLHSRYLSGDVSGENRVVEDEVRVLRDAGHEVRVFSSEPTTKRRADLLRTAGSAVWSGASAHKVETLVRGEGIDVVHVHNLFPTLSPTVLRAANRGGAAVVMTLHNYRLLCLPATLIRDGRTCEDCLGRTPWPGVLHACYRESHLGSAVLASSLTLHRSLGSFDLVDRFAAVSTQVRATHVRGGIAPERIVVKPNFAPASGSRQGPGSGFLYLGRLTPEKGVRVLMETWGRLPAGAPELVVVGDGPEAEALRAHPVEGVRFRGEVAAAEVPALIAGARAVLVPSLWEEPAVPRVVLEAYAAGVPVVVSDRGALPDGVDDDRSGYVVPAEDAGAWADRIGRLAEDATSERLGEGALSRWRERFSPASGVLALEALYAEAVQVSRGARS
jgi:glycosyltransferase involved in cell wall biosynthesis